MLGLPFFAVSWRSLIERARARICGADRVLCGILLALKPVEAPGLGTLGVTKDGRLLVDPKAVMEYTLHGRRIEELARILVHEALHVLFLHPERCEKLGDLNICNVAADAIVEATIEESVRGDPSLARTLGFYTEDGVLNAPRPGSEYHKRLEALREFLEKCGVPWDMVLDETLESIYKKLEACLRKKGGAPAKSIDSHPWGGAQPSIVAPRGGSISSGREQLGEIARMAAKMVEEGGGAGPSGIAGKLPGVVPGEWENVLELTGLRAKLNWRQLLQRLLDRYAPLDYTWRRPSRRSEALRVYLPGPLKRGWKITVALDTSGSIEDDEYREFLAALYELLADRPVETLVVVEADVRVQRMQVFTDPPPPAVIEWARRRRGYGGTVFSTVIDEILEKHPDTDLIIYFTDGYGYYPKTQPRVPIIWVISRRGVKPGSRYWPPIGHVVKIE